MAVFKSKNGKVPFPRTETEVIGNAVADAEQSGVFLNQESYEKIAKQASHKIHQDVFGHDYKTDAKGNPIETGKGSASQPTAQHQQALMISQEAEAKRAMTMGWHPGLAHAFDPSAAPAVRRRRGPNKKKRGPKGGAPLAPAAAEA